MWFCADILIFIVRRNNPHTLKIILVADKDKTLTQLVHQNTFIAEFTLGPHFNLGMSHVCFLKKKYDEITVNKYHFSSLTSDWLVTKLKTKKRTDN